MTLERSERRAILTGAASGLGRGLALRLAAEGAALGLIDIDADRLDAVAAQARSLGSTVETRVLDVAELDELQRVVTHLADTLGGIELCAPMAGVFVDGVSAELGAEPWELAFRVNTDHAVTTTRAALGWSRTHGAPCHVLLAGSDSILRPHHGMGPYAASKAALTSCALTLNQELVDEPDRNVTLGMIFRPCPSWAARPGRIWTTRPSAWTASTRTWPPRVMQPNSPCHAFSTGSADVNWWSTPTAARRRDAECRISLLPWSLGCCRPDWLLSFAARARVGGTGATHTRTPRVGARSATIPPKSTAPSAARSRSAEPSPTSTVRSVPGPHPRRSAGSCSIVQPSISST